MTIADWPVVQRPFFMTGCLGKLFAIHLQPVNSVCPTRGILFFPPFGEEMNKSRRMVSLQARRFAASGYQVLLVDLYGTGDSEGDFEDARWDIWHKDMMTAATWLRDSGVSQLTVWGLRLGALLGVQIAADIQPSVEQIVLWQPVTKGETFLTQFLRIRFAAQLVSGRDKLTTSALRDDLQNGKSVDVAGYTLNPALAATIDSLAIDDWLTRNPAPLFWFQVSPMSSTATTATRIQNIRDSNQFETTTIPIVGDRFWQSAEIAVVNELLYASTDSLAI